MIAVLSDVHANLEALTAVMKDLSARGVDKIAFLGDMIGYGPDPRAVLNFLKRFQFCLLGNHDLAVLEGPPSNFNAAAQAAVRWTRVQISPFEMGAAARFLRPRERAARLEHWKFLASLKPLRHWEDFTFVHDTPLAAGSAEYLMKAEQAHEAFERYPKVRAFFIGHSHVPKVITEREVWTPEPGKRYTLDQRLVVNVGSVGQPRDGDPRACYVLIEDGFVRYYRVPYDVESAAAKIRKVGALDPVLADRLFQGL
jgi:predicted phosphodiesterase